MNAAPNGSITQRDAPRPDLLAFAINSRITEPDIEWMSSVVEEAMGRFQKIDMLIVMQNYEGSDFKAKFDNYAASVQARSVAHVRRYAVVGAPATANAMINISGLFMPVETSTFELVDEAKAWAWLEQST